MKKSTHLAFAFTLAVALMTPAILVAGPDNQRTELTVNRAIEVPGATLQPGDYIVEVANMSGDDSIVVFRDADSMETVSLSLTVPTRRADIPGESKFTFFESPAGKTPALRSWFYPGTATGHQFVYPEGRSKEIAKSARRYVPSAADNDYKQFDYRSADPQKIGAHKVTVYAIAPDSGKSSLDEGMAFNREADRVHWMPDAYVRAREMEESRIERQIRKEIVTLPFYSVWDHIEYRVDDDKVTLMGSVYRPSMKKSVERVVKNIEGVNTVNNEVEAQPLSPQDDRIRRATYRAIYGHPSLVNYQVRAVPPIHIIVENGNVTLEGVVQNSMDKNVAFIQANGVSGVFQVTNNLRTES